MLLRTPSLLIPRASTTPWQQQAWPTARPTACWSSCTARAIAPGRACGASTAPPIAVCWMPASRRWRPLWILRRRRARSCCRWDWPRWSCAAGPCRIASAVRCACAPQRRRPSCRPTWCCTGTVSCWAGSRASGCGACRGRPWSGCSRCLPRIKPLPGPPISCIRAAGCRCRPAPWRKAGLCPAARCCSATRVPVLRWSAGSPSTASRLSVLLSLPRQISPALRL